MRLKFSRLGQAKMLSHLEQIRLLRRMMEKSGLPCICSRRGKMNVVKMSFGPAISVGYESMAEYADAYFQRNVDEKEITNALSSASEGGILLVSAKRVPLSFPSIEALANAAEYEVCGEFSQEYFRTNIAEFLKNKEIFIAKNKTGGCREIIDARRLVISMEIKDRRTLKLLLRFGPKRNVKPEHIVFISSMNMESAGDGKIFEIANSDSGGFQVKRVELYWENSEGRLMPI